MNCYTTLQFRALKENTFILLQKCLAKFKCVGLDLCKYPIPFMWRPGFEAFSIEGFFPGVLRKVADEVKEKIVSMTVLLMDETSAVGF